ncbi:hypothetical protein HZA26_04215 [Candidatus Nomurabacteria bacterium]|nr:hypothetical protein [Candidatus Nomurabacteria bacterium]
MEIKFFKRKKHFRKGGLRVNPDFFWEVILITGFLVFLSSCVFGFYLFNTISQKFALPDDEFQDPNRAVSKERIDKVLEYFSEKENKSEKIINSPSPVVDPSR